MVGKYNMENNQDIVRMPWQKRAFDIILSLVLLVLLLPLWLLILLAIFIEHIFKGNFFAPLFYVEKRISQGQKFRFAKFNIFKPGLIEGMRKRGMFIHTKKLEHKKGDLTIVGKCLQKTYLDEVPQLLSILKGDISFVGPRPVNLEVYQNALNNGHFAKKVIKSGLTGKFQSLKGLTRHSDFELDDEYVKFCREHSGWQILFLDIKIIFKTLRVLFRAEGI